MPNMFVPAADILRHIERSMLAVSPLLDDYRRSYDELGNGAAKPARKRRERARPLDGLLTADEAAARLRCSIKTLNGYIASGAVRYVAIGHGSKRPRKMFTATDLDEFIVNQTKKDAPSCQSSKKPVRLIGGTTFRSEGTAFTDRQNARTVVKLKP